MSSISIVDLEPKHIDAAGAVLHEGLLTAAETGGGYLREHLRTREVEASRRRVRRLVEQGGIGLVAEDRDKGVVGFTIWTAGEGEAEIVMMYTDPASQKKGIGSRLMREALARLQHDRVENVRLLSTVWSRTFYEGQGFKATGETEPDNLVGTTDDNGNEVMQTLYAYSMQLPAGTVR